MSAYDQNLEHLEREVRALTARVAKLEAELAHVRRVGGIQLRGWWCTFPRNHHGDTIACDTFNGEEGGPRTECRVCGMPKPVNPERRA